MIEADTVGVHEALFWSTIWWNNSEIRFSAHCQCHSKPKYKLLRDWRDIWELQTASQ